MLQMHTSWEFQFFWNRQKRKCPTLYKSAELSYMAMAFILWRPKMDFHIYCIAEKELNWFISPCQVTLRIKGSSRALMSFKHTTWHCMAHWWYRMTGWHASTLAVGYAYSCPCYQLVWGSLTSKETNKNENKQWKTKLFYSTSAEFLMRAVIIISETSDICPSAVTKWLPHVCNFTFVANWIQNGTDCPSLTPMSYLLLAINSNKARHTAGIFKKEISGICDGQLASCWNRVTIGKNCRRNTCRHFYSTSHKLPF